MRRRRRCRKARLGSSGIGSRRRRLLRARRFRHRSGWSGDCGHGRAGRECSRSAAALRDWLGWMFRMVGRWVGSVLRVSESTTPVAPSCLYFEVPLFGMEGESAVAPPPPPPPSSR